MVPVVIDVSEYQGLIDWTRVFAAGVRGAYIRTALVDRKSRRFTVDQRWLRNIAEARRAGLIVGGYFYARAGAMPAVEQAERFLTVATPRPGDLPPMLDLEEHDGLGPAALAEWSPAFMGHLTNGLIALGLEGRPAFYTMPGFSSRLGSGHGLGKYPLVVAHVADAQGWPRTAPPHLPWGFTGYVLHQFSWTGRVPGIGGNVDEQRLAPGVTLESLTLRRAVSPPVRPPVPPRGEWPTPLPKWFWAWARWRLGEGEHETAGPGKGLRPAVAPERIPAWAWARLEALVAQRAGERVEPDEPAEPAEPRPQPVEPRPPRPKPPQEIRAAQQRLVDVWLELAKRPELGHYDQDRPAQHTRDKVTLAQVKAGKHWTGDCSSTVGDWGPSLAAIAPAPHGPWTNTTWIGREWRRVTVPQLGDAVLYQGHVVGIVGFRDSKPTRDRDDIYVFSHGSEAGPYGWPVGELAAGYRDDFVGFYRHPSLTGR